MYDFSAERLLRDSGGFSQWKMEVFSASCSEVLISCYRKFSELEGVGDPDYMEEVLEGVWAALLTPRDGASGVDLPASQEILMMLPDQDEEWNEWSACAENAVASVGLLLELMAGGGREVVARIAQQSYEAVDWIAADDLDPPFVDARQAELILGSEIVQVELGRQLSAIEALRVAQDGQLDVVSALRRDAVALSIGERRRQG